jgi:hypothetical protein
MLTVICIIIAQTAHAVKPDCPNSLNIVPVDLQFGNFIGGSAGTITVPLTGGRTSTVVILVGGAVVSSATFTLSTTDSRCGNRKITVTGIPTALILTTGLTVGSITSTLANGDTFKLVNNTYVFTIGGTLSTDGTQSNGTYSTPFDVNFNY